MNKKALIIIALCALGLCIGETHAINTISLAPSLVELVESIHKMGNWLL